MTFIFSLTLFLSACLLLFVQPMVGKMLLPVLGGSHSVWNTCMVFFQGLLLGGYIYGHLSTKFLAPRRQALVHVGVLLLPLVVLPIVLSPQWLNSVPTESDPTLWLLGVLVVTVGLPFFAVSTSAPIFQKWFSQTNHRDAADPYFLYAASNAGSIAGLLAYPLFLERLASVPEQAQLWQYGYVALIALALGCAGLMWRYRGHIDAPTDSARDSSEQLDASSTGRGAPALTIRRRGWWVLLAFVPSSLMLGVTSYVTTDLAPVPLLWVIPLGLYLLSFIIVFARRPFYPPWWMGRGMCLVAVGLVIAFLVESTHPPVLFAVSHLVLFFVAALAAHGRLAADRPHTDHLTEYFLWISVGGVLGGIFNALIAPLIFTRILEYVLVIALACAVRQTAPDEAVPKLWKKTPVVYALVVACVGAIIWGARHFQFGTDPTLSMVAFGVPAILVCTQVARPWRFAGGLAVLILAGSFYSGYHQPPIFYERNFYSTLRVADDYDDNIRQLIDGNTIHGRQRLEDQGCTPLSYYHRGGPAGSAFGAYHDRGAHPDDTSRIAVIGMGIGSLACYGQAHEHWDLYELNPMVIDVATDPDYFTILDRSPAGSHRIIAGDGRLQLERSTRADEVLATYDVIVVDAFSSGSIPVHLMTREALELYTDRLSPRGFLLFNVSNRVLDLPPILADIAAELDYSGYAVVDDFVTEREQAAGKDPSVWVLMAPDEATLEFVRGWPGARKLDGDASAREWTDSYSNILAALFSLD
jgi:hypothetical protein